MMYMLNVICLLTLTKTDGVEEGSLVWTINQCKMTSLGKGHEPSLRTDRVGLVD